MGDPFEYFELIRLTVGDLVFYFFILFPFAFVFGLAIARAVIGFFLPELDEKPKRKPLEDEFYDEKPKRYFEIGDDGELVEWVNTREE